MKKQRETKAIVVLIFVTAIWGMTFIIIQNAVTFINPIVFVFLRMVLASIGFLPLVYNRFRNTDRRTLLGGLILAALIAATYIFQTEGLQTIPASRSAFITGIGVVIVPILAPLFRQGSPKPIEFLAAVICVIGLYILTGAKISNFQIGDLWTFGCAFSYAFTIFALQIITKRSQDTILLSFYATLFGIIPVTILLPHFSWHVVLHWQVIIALVFCALLATTLVTYLMFAYQKYTSVTKAAIIYTLEPVFATLFAFMIGNQLLTRDLVLGGILIIISNLLPHVIKWQSKKPLAMLNR